MLRAGRTFGNGIPTGGPEKAIDEGTAAPPTRLRRLNCRHSINGMNRRAHAPPNYLEGVSAPARQSPLLRPLPTLAESSQASP